MSRRLFLQAMVVALASPLVVVPSAFGAQRFATPTGAGANPCNPTPCSFAQAVTGASAGDEVIVGAGSYTLNSNVNTNVNNLYVHGDFNGPMPVINATMSNYPFYVINAQNSHVSYFELNNTASSSYGFLCANGGKVDRVRANITGSAAVGAHIEQTCELRDSVIRVNGANSVAVTADSAASGTVPPGLTQNVTAIATGTGSTGIRSISNSGFPGAPDYELDVRNSIASGEGADLRAAAGIFSEGNIVVTNSNFDTPVHEGNATIGGNPNQAAPPLFVDAAGGNYSEASGSPTIDAGSAAGVTAGELDLAGNARTLGAAPDIGAYEFTPAVPAPPAQTQVQSVAVGPKSFKPLNGGGSIFARKKKSAPVGTTITYVLSASAATTFTVEKTAKGRKSGGKCKKQTSKNRKRKKCTLYKPVKGSFTHAGVAGQNKLKFSGRVNNKALRPGNYRLVATVGPTVKRANFKIVR